MGGNEINGPLLFVWNVVLNSYSEYCIASYKEDKLKGYKLTNFEKTGAQGVQRLMMESPTENSSRCLSQLRAVNRLFFTKCKGLKPSPDCVGLCNKG